MRVTIPEAKMPLIFRAGSFKAYRFQVTCLYAAELQQRRRRNSRDPYARRELRANRFRAHAEVNTADLALVKGPFSVGCRRLGGRGFLSFFLFKENTYRCTIEVSLTQK